MGGFIKKIFRKSYYGKFLKSSQVSNIIAAIIIAFVIFGIIGAIASNNAAKEDSDKTQSTETPTIIDKKEKDNSSSQMVLYRVTNVVDGDTIDVIIDGNTQRVRLIGVNTPETVHPNKAQECFGKEASDYTKSMLSGKMVGIETDDSQDRYDKYNRLLAYVYLDDENFNLNLIKNGYAYEYTYNVPYKYQAQFKEAQKYASENNVGLWAPDACSATNASSGQNSSSNVEVGPECNIKGNISSKGEKIYHTPDQKYYESTKIDTTSGERWFCSEQEAQAAGWRKSKV